MPLVTPNGRGLGLRRQLPDARDITHPVSLSQVPTSVDLRGSMPAIYDQGQIGSCVGNAVACAVEYDRVRQGLPVWTPSRLFIYYGARAAEGSTGSDAGATIRDGVAVPARLGVCSEDGKEYPHIKGRWFYDIGKVLVQPPGDAYYAASHHRSGAYHTVPQNLAAIKATLASLLPVVIGIAVYSSFESPTADATGDIPMPGSGEALLGGHAILLVGYDDTTQRVRFRNSWGQWGSNGYGTLPYQYVIDPNLAFDFWVISSLLA